MQRQTELEIKALAVAPAGADDAGQPVALAAGGVLAVAAVVHTRKALGAQSVTAGATGGDGLGGAVVVGVAELGGLVGDFGEEGAH